MPPPPSSSSQEGTKKTRSSRARLASRSRAVTTATSGKTSRVSTKIAAAVVSPRQKMQRQRRTSVSRSKGRATLSPVRKGQPKPQRRPTTQRRKSKVGFPPDRTDDASFFGVGDPSKTYDSYFALDGEMPSLADLCARQPAFHVPGYLPQVSDTTQRITYPVPHHDRVWYTHLLDLCESYLHMLLRKCTWANTLGVPVESLAWIWRTLLFFPETERVPSEVDIDSQTLLRVVTGLDDHFGVMLSQPIFGFSFEDPTDPSMTEKVAPQLLETFAQFKESFTSGKVFEKLEDKIFQQFFLLDRVVEDMKSAMLQLDLFLTVLIKTQSIERIQSLITSETFMKNTKVFREAGVYGVFAIIDKLLDNSEEGVASVLKELQQLHDPY